MGFLLRQLEDTVESGILNNMNIKKECKGDYLNVKVMDSGLTPPSLVLKLDLRV